MSSISLFPCALTPAATVASDLAKSLDLELYTDEQLLEETAARNDLSVERLRPMIYGKTSVFNQFTLEREKMVNLCKETLIEKLDGPRACLYYGFLATLISPRIDHVLKVLVVDGKKERIELGIQEGLSEREAKKTVKSHDVSAYGWTDFLARKEAYDSSLYDLVIPVEGKSAKEIEATIVKCLHTTTLLRTPESMQAVADMRAEVEAERLLLAAGHKVAMQCVGGKMVLTVEKSVLNFTRLAGELADIAGRAPGVREVRVEKSVHYNDSIYRQQKFELPSKVLFVDDEKDFVQTVSERLISRDVGTYGVYNGEDALELLAEDRPEVMVLDLKMPGLHGVEVLRRTKEMAPDVEVIILTGHGTSDDMRECMALGAFAYMNKPVDIEELSATIKAANDKVHNRS